VHGSFKRTGGAAADALGAPLATKRHTRHEAAGAGCCFLLRELVQEQDRAGWGGVGMGGGV
jgi:hypothetical protein